MNKTLKEIDSMIDERVKKASEERAEINLQILECDKLIAAEQEKMAKCASGNNGKGWKEAKREEEYQKDRRKYFESRLKAVDLSMRMTVPEYEETLKKIKEVTAEATLKEFESSKECIKTMVEAYSESEKTYKEAWKTAFKLYTCLAMQGTKCYNEPARNDFVHGGFITPLSHIHNISMLDSDRFIAELSRLPQYNTALKILERR